MAKKIPLRVCTGCGEAKPKKEMIRILRTPEEEIVLDTTGKKNGRGAYICCSVDCLHRATKTKGLERSLTVEIPRQLLDIIEKELVSLESGIKEGI